MRIWLHYVESFKSKFLTVLRQKWFKNTARIFRIPLVKSSKGNSRTMVESSESEFSTVV